MGTRIKFCILCIICTFCFSTKSLAQHEPRARISLSQLIVKIQNQFNVKFNYAEETIANSHVDQPNENWSLQRTLKFLEEQTHLSFTSMDDGLILINPKVPQILCGYVIDKNTEQPLVFATVQSPSKNTVTDENGYFELEVLSISHSISINHLGYGTILMPYKVLNFNHCETIGMIPDLEHLSEIIISDYMTSGINKLTNGSFQIDFEKFDILPGMVDTDVLQAVQAFPGIQSSNETVSNINIRGGTHDQNLITWDGIKMYQSGHFFGLISMFNPQITQKVSLLKNGTDVTLTDGVSGTISMKSNPDVTTEFNGSLGVNFIDANGFVDVPLNERSSLQIAARKSISDFIETPTYTNFFNRISQNTEVQNNSENNVNSDQQFDFYDTSLRWLYKVTERDLLQVNFLYASNELRFNENSVINNEERSKESSLKQQSFAGGIKYQRLWSDVWRSSLEIYETDYKLSAINANIEDNQRFLQENIVSETSARLELNYKMSPSLELLSGYHFVETQVTNLDDVDNPLFRLLISEVVRTHGVFSQLNYNSSDSKTFFNLGSRYNYIDKYHKHILEPRLSFSQRFLNYFSLEILGEFKHQNTSQVINFQNDFLGIEKRRWQLSNDQDIPVIQSKQLSIGLNCNVNGWLFSTEGYLKTVNGITTQSQGFQNQYEFTQTQGRYDAFGMDVIIRKKTGQLNTWLSYGFMKNNYTFNTLPEPTFSSNFDITHSLTLGATYTTRYLKLSSGFNWHSGKPITTPNSSQPIVDNQVNFNATNANTLNDYLRWDMSALYRLKIDKTVRADLGLSIWNILDQTNQINRFYRINDGVINESQQNSLRLTTNLLLCIYF
ncbi:MAG: TonB-dependent receptor [Algicola sp.]|nr:TonB-dependent receptor [Algicola sp.]